MNTRKIQLLMLITLTFTLSACGSSTPVREDGNGSIVEKKADRAGTRAANRVEHKVDQKTDRTVDRAIDRAFRKIF